MPWSMDVFESAIIMIVFVLAFWSMFYFLKMKREQFNANFSEKSIKPSMTQCRVLKFRASASGTDPNACVSEIEVKATSIRDALDLIEQQYAGATVTEIKQVK